MEFKLGYLISLGILLIVAVIGQSPGGGAPVYSRDLETSLRTELFNSNYSVLQRPSQKVVANVSLTLLTVNDLNIKDQVLSITGFLTIVWSDDRLSWSDTTTTTTDYTSVHFLFSSQTYVWKPILLIENSVDDISVISDDDIPMRISQDGEISWNPAGIYKVLCESDITYYPLDSQTCTIKLTTWAYTQDQIQLELSETLPAVDLEMYSENGEWDLTSATGYKADSKARGPQSFSSLAYVIKMRRRPLFHILNTIFPVVLMAFLIPMVYKLPADSGEKMGYCLTVLLAYAVYLTMISDNIPSTSLHTCYLSIYLDLTLTYSTLAVNFVIIVLYAHHQGEKEVPRWIYKITTTVIAKLALEHGRCCKSEKIPPPVCVTPVVPISDERTLSTKKTNFDDKIYEKDIKENEENMTYAEFSLVFDKCCFNVYMVLTLLTGVLFVLLLSTN